MNSDCRFRHLPVGRFSWLIDMEAFPATVGVTIHWMGILGSLKWRQWISSKVAFISLFPDCGWIVVGVVSTSCQVRMYLWLTVEITVCFFTLFLVEYFVEATVKETGNNSKATNWKIKPMLSLLGDRIPPNQTHIQSLKILYSLPPTLPLSFLTHT